ncbi:hypothetical protein Franean1_5027 [Parafrankia sp. EAN1pec]|nr:hypothetical protein Franean1_5027 [Frankia sp. EAN1pec]
MSSPKKPASAATLAALGTLSAATRGRWRIKAGPSWTEPLALYVAAVADPGEHSGTVLRAVAAPLLEAERLAHASRADDHRKALRRHHVAQRRYETAVEAAAQAPAAQAREANERVIEAIEDLARHPEPDDQRITVGHVEPRALPVLLAAEGGALAQLATSGGLLAAIADPGDAEDGWVALFTLLRAYDGQALSIDREPDLHVHVEEPFMALVVTLTPEEIASPSARQHLRGLLPRLLFAAPAPMAGTRTTDSPAMPDEVNTVWAGAVRGVLDAALRADGITMVELEPAAREIFEVFRAGWEPRLHPETGDLADIQTWATKHPGRAARIAALLALAEDPATTTVGVEHVWAAVNLAEVHMAHARVALTGAGVEGAA